MLYQLSYSHRRIDYTTALRPCQKADAAVETAVPNWSARRVPTGAPLGLCKTFNFYVTDDLYFDFSSS